jgi:hypothetical protein
MKTVLTVLSILLLAAPNYDFFIEPWNMEESKIVDGIVITRISGENTDLGITNISYETQKKMLSDLKYRVKKEGLSKDRQSIYAEKYKRKASGGQLHVYLTRNDFDLCNMDYFEVYIYDKKGHEMFKQDYPNQIPKTNRDQPAFMWKNEGKMMIMPDLYLPITIEVVDKSSGEEVKHQFTVSQQ